jgi:hypothetical protein
VLFKVYCKILVLLRLIQNFDISDLAIAKVEKVNIAYSHSSVKHHRLYSKVSFWPQMEDKTVRACDKEKSFIKLMPVVNHKKFFFRDEEAD